jgi:hypothetical protein
MVSIESSARVLFPLLEERARERGGCPKPSVNIYSPTQPNPTLKGEGVRHIRELRKAFYRLV